MRRRWRGKRRRWRGNSGVWGGREGREEEEVERG